MYCCEMKNSTVETLQVILSCGPRINLQDTIGRTALHLACRSGRHEFVKVLVKVPNIDVNRRTLGGETPLMKAT